MKPLQQKPKNHRKKSNKKSQHRNRTFECPVIREISVENSFAKLFFSIFLARLKERASSGRNRSFPYTDEYVDLDVLDKQPKPTRASPKKPTSSLRQQPIGTTETKPADVYEDIDAPIDGKQTRTSSRKRKTTAPAITTPEPAKRRYRKTKTFFKKISSNFHSQPSNNSADSSQSELPSKTSRNYRKISANCQTKTRPKICERRTRRSAGPHRAQQPFKFRRQSPRSSPRVRLRNSR